MFSSFHAANARRLYKSNLIIGTDGVKCMGVTIKPKDDGPYMVIGDFELVDGEGKKLKIDAGQSVQLCRCGQSANKPFCDDSHKRAGFESKVRV